MDLSEMRTRLRRDLHDEDGAGYRWTDAVLDRHIAHALRDLGEASPLEARASLTTTAGSRELSLSALTGLVRVEAVEYPSGRYPPSYCRFSVWEGILTLLVDGAPAGAEPVNVYYGKLHTLDATTSTLPPALEDLVAVGAAAYAALEWAGYASSRVNVAGEETWRNYFAWGQERLAAFTRGLARRRRRRVRQLYVPSALLPGQSTDWGP